MIRGHGGNIYQVSQQLGCRPADIVDMSSNVNPLGPMPELVAHLKQSLEQVKALPEVDGQTMIEAYAQDIGLDPDCIIAGNGTTQLIYTLPLALKPREVLIVGPTYSDYADACRIHQVPFRFLLANEKEGFKPEAAQIASAASGCDTVIICNPNNPTGQIMARGELVRLCRAHPQKRFVIDESYLPFVGDYRSLDQAAAQAPNMVVLQSMSKIFRIPGLRIGFLVAGGEVANAVRRFMQPWSVNALAQSAVMFFMHNPKTVESFVQQSRSFISTERKWVSAQLAAHPKLNVHSSCTSFFLVSLPPALAAKSVCRELVDKRILIRNCANFTGLSQRYIRISIKDRTSNRLLARELGQIVAPGNRQKG